MNIDGMTYGELKRIAVLFQPAPQPGNINIFIGQYCIARCYRAGVHAGEVVSVMPSGDGCFAVVLKNSRRLHGWKANKGIALSGVAISGLNYSSNNHRIDMMVSDQFVTDCCELIPCSEIGKESIKNAP